MLVGWIAIAAVALEIIGLAVAVITWGAPALFVGGPVLFATVTVTVVVWTLVIPQRMLRARVEGLPLRGAPAGWRAAQEFHHPPSGSGSSSGVDPTPSGPAWPSDGGLAADHAGHHGWHGSSEGGWSGEGSGSSSDSTSSSSSDSSSSSSSSSSDSSSSSS